MHLDHEQLLLVFIIVRVILPAIRHTTPHLLLDRQCILTSSCSLSKPSCFNGNIVVFLKRVKKVE